MKARILTLMMLALAVAFAGLTTATAHADPIDAPAQVQALFDLLNNADDFEAAFAALTPAEQAAVAKYSAVAEVQTVVENEVDSTGDLLMSSPGGCATHTVTKIGKDWLGGTLYKFKSKTRFCFDWTYITNDPHWNVTGTVHSSGWIYVGVQWSSESGGEGYTYHHDSVQGYFKHCLPDPIGCQIHRYPAIDKSQYGDATMDP